MSLMLFIVVLEAGATSVFATLQGFIFHRSTHALYINRILAIKHTINRLVFTLLFYMYMTTGNRHEYAKIC